MKTLLLVLTAVGSLFAASCSCYDGASISTPSIDTGLSAPSFVAPSGK